MYSDKTRPNCVNSECGGTVANSVVMSSTRPNR